MSTKTSKKNKESTNVTMDGDIFKEVDDLSVKEIRSFSSMVEVLIREALLQRKAKKKK